MRPLATLIAALAAAFATGIAPAGGIATHIINPATAPRPLAASITTARRGTPARVDARYAAVVDALEPFIAHEMRQKALPALSIALVDDQQIVWAKGFGYAHPVEHIPATAQTVYRVGSVSKLFTDIAIMQLVERGKLDLDAPVSRYVPVFKVHNPFGKPITLRELMAHHSGLVREPPVGNYFDNSSPSLAATIQSLNATTLVYAPGTHTKYSNAGIAVVGYVLEATKHEPFAQYLKHAVLDPMGLTSSAFVRDSSFSHNVADAFMWTTYDRTFPAPTFELGMAPAGSMYTTVTDLGHFLSILFAGGRGPHGQILKTTTLESMWKPQFTHPGEHAGYGYGLGFGLSTLEGHRMVGHGGAIYGFATQLSALPDDKLGVVVVTTEDAVNTVTSHIADVALRLMLAEHEHQALPALDTTTALPAGLAHRVAGRYGTGDKAVDLIASNDSLYFAPVRGDTRAAVRLLRGDTLMVDGRLEYGPRIIVRDGAIVVGGEALRHVDLPKPPPVAAQWRGLIGEYGWDYDKLFILEQDGKLQALIEWFTRYPLEQESANVYRFPKWGLYDNEQVTFTRDAHGRATQVQVGGVIFPRRATGPEDGSQFHITPVRPVAELRRIALAAQPLHESGTFWPSDLVELVKLDTSIHLDIRYATTNNFLRTPMYREARAFMQRPAAEAVVRASQWLHKLGYGLLIHDAYRPWYVTKMFWDATPVDKHIFVADPSEGSRHNRGCAVDLELYDLKTGKPLPMVGGYDEMTDRSYPLYPGGTSLQRWDRALLRRAMEMQGFRVYEAEWWHFDYKDWRHYAIGNVPFDKIAAAR